MKKTYLLLTVISLAMISCTKDFKEIKDIKEKENSITNAQVNCTGNNWELDDIFYGPRWKDPVTDELVPFIWTTLVYDNKIYVFDYTEQEVRFYNGIDWNSIPSAIPLSAATNEDPNGAPYNRNFGFTIGNKGYIGKHKSGCDNFWEYSFTSNTWTEKACFPGVGGTGAFSANAATFSIGNKGYVVAGEISYQVYSNATWEYDQVQNTWSQKAYIGRLGRGYAAGFSIGNKGYIVNGVTHYGNSYIYLTDLLEYDPLADAWTKKSSFPGTATGGTNVFVIDGKAYAGKSSGTLTKFYRYNPATNSWSQVADAPVNTDRGFSLNGKGYVTFSGNNGTGMLKYNPLNCFDSSPL
jgi:hypothetical protein